jgi:hypothetical protein
MQYEEIRDAIALAGLLVRGAFAAAPGDSLPDAGQGRPTLTLVLVGNAGAAGWAGFAAQTAGGTRPLERWTRERVEPLAQWADARAVYPEDQPFLPFLRWARRAEDVHPSPLGLVIHPEYGLWHSYRAALLLPYRMDLAPRSARPAPCETCTARPCLHACPVGAFNGEHFDSGACRSHLASPEGATCLHGGCKARNACPVGTNYRYAPEQIRFHMAAFRAGTA